ncbi:MAG: hypothetical protein OXQ28_14770, partial [Acidobacteriota bacterium]|nr:hypothetical protein [Acidobacteriota bacterium]
LGAQPPPPPRRPPRGPGVLWGGGGAQGSGAVWRWVDEEMVWVREPPGLSSDVDAPDPESPRH